MFRFKQGVKVDYDKQGYIYFLSRRYKELPEEKRRRIEWLCREQGGQYADALMEFVTTDTSGTAVCMKYFLSKSTLYRLVKKYYEAFGQVM